MAIPLRRSPRLLTVATLAPAPAQAQRRATPNDTLKSTEVAADRKVTFRIYAPKAVEVSVSGDFGRGGKMEKDDAGVWSLTVGPLTPDFYTYTFNVDGVRVVDPKNAMIKQYTKLFAMEGVRLSVTKDALKALAAQAVTKGTGARALRSMLRPPTRSWSAPCNPQPQETQACPLLSR